MKIIGLTKEALQYIYKNSNFTKYDGSMEPIGCGYSDGIASVSATMYDRQEVDGNIICLFEYHLKNGSAKEVIQKIQDDKVFLCLAIKNRKKFKWEVEDD